LTSSQQNPLKQECACEDLQCWSKKTNDASSEQFECAAKLLNTAASLSSGGATTIIGVTLEARNFMNILSEYQNKTNSNQQLSLLEFFSSLGQICESSSLLAQKFNPATASCVGSVVGSIGSSCAIASTLFDLASSAQSGADAKQIGEKIWKILPIIPNSLGLTKDIITLGECFGVPVAPAMKPFGSMVEKIGALLTAAECGATSAKNYVLLMQNSACLGQDIYRVRSGNHSVVSKSYETNSRAETSPSAKTSARGDLTLDNLKIFASTHGRTTGAELGNQLLARGVAMPKEECESACEKNLCKSEYYKKSTQRFRDAGILLDRRFVKNEVFNSGCFRACIDITGYSWDRGHLQTRHDPNIPDC